MVGKEDLTVILDNLQKVLDSNIKWDIVELGCNIGTTSLFIRKLLDINKSNKDFHVYDSFQWLPKKINQDGNNHSRFTKGACKTQKDYLIFNFQIAKLKIPKIHIGWFGQIPDKEYPKKIAFAFFDWDFYTSILDSFKKVYPRLEKGAIITLHDYDVYDLPGVKKACIDFLENKPEKWTIKEKENVGILLKV
jgi:hypothetical protein